MKRQDISGQNTLHTDGSGGAGTDVNIASVGGTPVTSPLPVTGTLTPSGTFDENLKQVNGQTVNVGVGAAGTGTQRVTTSTDSTIATVTAVTAITNALPAGSNVIGHVIADTGSTTAVTGNVTVVQTTASNLNAQVVGNIASDGVDSGNPVKVGNLAKSADITAVSDADRVDQIASLLGKQIGLPYATPALTWSYAAAAGGLVTTGGVTAKTAGTGAQRNYITSVQAINSHATISTEVVIRDGASGTTLWRGWAQAAGGGCAARFDPPLRGTAATLVEIAEITATASTGVLMNVQGYLAAE